MVEVELEHLDRETKTSSVQIIETNDLIGAVVEGIETIEYYDHPNVTNAMSELKLKLTDGRLIRVVPLDLYQIQSNILYPVEGDDVW